MQWNLKNGKDGGADLMAKSIIQSNKECFMCRRILGAGVQLPDRFLEEHHIFNAANRKHSDKYGLTVWLCPAHHRTGKNAVHSDYQAMVFMKRIGQMAFEERYGHEEFMNVFGKNYLEV